MASANLWEAHALSLSDAQCSLIFGKGHMGNPFFWASLSLSQQVMIVSNDVVAPLYLNVLKSALPSVHIDVCILPDGEIHKNQESLFVILEALMVHNAHRDTPVIALGGGVIGDMAGLAAALYQRGVPCIQVPTTLLAQVDASIGGKTAINFDHAKNMLGTFYQPSTVVIDVDVLSTLPKREFRAGLGEVIKYGMLTGGIFWQELRDTLHDDYTESSSEYWQKIIKTCALIKAEYVEKDEKESNIRALLNLGHTFAHALESVTHFSKWLHGEAVAIGLCCAARMSHYLGYLTLEDVSDVINLCAKVGLPTQIPQTIVIEDLLSAMNRDKKIQQKKLRFIICKQWGNCVIADDVPSELLIKTLNDAYEGEHV